MVRTHVLCFAKWVVHYSPALIVNRCASKLKRFRFSIFHSIGNIRLSRAGDTWASVQSFGAKIEGTTARSPKEGALWFAIIANSLWFSWLWFMRFRNIRLFGGKGVFKVFATVCETRIQTGQTSARNPTETSLQSAAGTLLNSCRWHWFITARHTQR